MMKKVVVGTVAMMIMILEEIPFFLIGMITKALRFVADKLETVNTEHNKRIWSDIVSTAADCVFTAVFKTAGAIQEAMCNAWQFRKECIRWEEVTA